MASSSSSGSATPSDDKLKTAHNALENAGKLAKAFWPYPDGTHGTSKGAQAYYAALAKGILAIDPDWAIPEQSNDAVLIEMHTRLVWLYSQWKAQEAVTFYKAFVTSLYQYDLGINNDQSSTKKKEQKAFENTAITATNDNAAWVYITKEHEPRHEIMDQAVTVTTMMLGVGKDQEKISRKLWEEREAKG
jgi:hypothetical protein